VDSGADIEVVTEAAYHITKCYDEVVHVAGPLPTDQGEALRMVDAVCATENEDGEVVLLKKVYVALSSDPDSMESLMNPHRARRAGWAVDDLSATLGGKQAMSIGDTVVPFELGQGDTMQFAVRRPTGAELSTMEPMILIGGEASVATSTVDTNLEMKTVVTNVSGIKRMMMCIFFLFGVSLLFWAYGLGSTVTCVNVEDLERLE